MAHRVANTIPRPPPQRAASEWTLAVTDAATAVSARRAFRAHLERYAGPDSDLAGAELIFAELAANVARHTPGPAAFHLHWRGARPMLLVLDRGGGFAPGPIRREADASAEHGRGLCLVHALGVRTRIGKWNGSGAYVCVILPVSR